MENGSVPHRVIDATVFWLRSEADRWEEKTNPSNPTVVEYRAIANRLDGHSALFPPPYTTTREHQ